jgi:hypothetical protein
VPEVADWLPGGGRRAPNAHAYGFRDYDDERGLIDLELRRHAGSREVPPEVPSPCHVEGRQH